MLKIGKCSSYGVNSLLFIRYALLYSTSTLPAATKGRTSPVFANYLISLGLSRAEADPIAPKLAQRWQNKKRKDDYYFKSMDDINNAPSSEFSRIWRKRGAKAVSDFNFISNADSVVSFLQRSGFRLPHVRLIVSEAPMILVSKVNTAVKPKVQAFLVLGLSVNDIVDLLGKSPNLFHYGMNSTIVPTLGLLKRLLGNHAVSFVNDADFVGWYDNGFQRFSKNFVPKMEMLLDYGVDTATFARGLPPWFPRVYHFLTKLDIKTLKNVAIMVDKKLGIPPHSEKFLTTICMFVRVIDDQTLDSFKKVFKSFGWTDSQIGLLIRTHPHCLRLSKNTISKTLDFLTNKLSYDPTYMVSRPSLFHYCLKTNIVPRYEVFRILKEKGLMKMNQDCWRALKMSAREFEDKFVIPYEDVHRVYCQHTSRGKHIERRRIHFRSLETKI